MCQPGQLGAGGAEPGEAVAAVAGRSTPTADYGSMIVVTERTVLSGAIARMLADEPPPASGSMATA